jgi:O-antigen/teichoic acid export membrane protein
MAFIERFVFKNEYRTACAVREIAYSLFFKTVVIVIGLAYVPLLLNSLTPERYGIWLTLTSVLSWFGFFDIGLGNGLRNKLSEAIAHNDHGQAKKYVSTTYFLSIIIFGMFFFLFHILNRYINWNAILNTDSITPHELYLLTSIVFSFFIARFVVQLLSTIYFSYQRPSFDSMILACSSLLSFVVIYGVLKIHNDIQLIQAGTIITASPVLIFIIFSFYSFFKVYPEIRPSFRDVNLELSRDLMSLGGKFFFLQFTAVILFSSSNFFIAQLYGAKEVAVYNVAFKYFQLPIFLYSILISPMWSAVTDAFVKGDYSWLKKTINYSNMLSAFFSVGILLMLLMSNTIYTVWVGENFHVPFILSFVIAVYSITNVFIAPYSSFINGTGKIKLTMNFTILCIVIYFTSIYFFKDYFDNSAGIVTAVILSSSMAGILQVIQVHKIVNKKAKGVWYQ